MAKSPNKGPANGKAKFVTAQTLTTPETTTATATSSTTPSTASVTTPDTITIPGQNPGSIHQQFNRIKQAEHKLMPPGQFKKLLQDEVERPKNSAQKKNVINARQGVILKIEAATNGKTLLYIRRGDVSKIYNNYFTANLDPAKTLVYDRTLKVQKTLADVKVGDVVRIIPVKGASLTLVEKIGQRSVQTIPPVPTTTGDTITIIPAPTTTTVPTATVVTPAP